MLKSQKDAHGWPKAGLQISNQISMAKGMPEQIEEREHDDIGNFCTMLGSESFHTLMDSWVQTVRAKLNGGSEDGSVLLDTTFSGFETVKNNYFRNRSESREFREDQIMTVMLDQLRKRGITVFQEGSRILPHFEFGYEDLGENRDEKYERVRIKLTARRQQTGMGQRFMRAVSKAVNGVMNS